MDGSKDSVTEHSRESDGSYCFAEYLEESASKATNSYMLICFHGSGSSHLRNWEVLLQSLNQQYRTIFLDRGPENPSPEMHIKVLWDYLVKHELKGPFILIAHSYGGTFAKHFVNAYPSVVSGMILVETGKGASADDIQATLVKKHRLGSKPLSVIRANSFLRQWQALNEDATSKGIPVDDHAYVQRKEWLRRCEEEDEKLETEQLKLSRNSKLVHLPTCGHNVVSERPDVISQEVNWVAEQADAAPTNVTWLSGMRKHFFEIAYQMIR